MILSDLLASVVIDSEGNELGSVADVRLVQDGPVVAGFGASLRVAGLMVGSRGLGTRLGYHRGDVKGPWLLRKMFAALERKALFVDWSDIADWDVEERRVRLRSG